MLRSLCFVFTLLLGGLLSAQTVENRYIVELSGEPGLAPDIGPAKAAPRRAAARNQQSQARAALLARNVDVIDSIELVANALIVNATEQDAAALQSVPGVKRVYPVRELRAHLDRAVLLQKVTDAWGLIGGPGNAGTGIKIGIIDTGVDSTHPGLQDPDLVVPDGFPLVNRSSDIGNTNNKVIVFRNYDTSPNGSSRDKVGHGTGVAMIAAGRGWAGPLGYISGIAPKAYIGAYKVFPDDREGAPTDLVLKAIDDAVADGMDVINMSLGGFPAERLDDDILGQAVERANRAGVLVVVSAGNDGPVSGTISSPATAPSAIAVGNAYTDRIFASAVRPEGVRPFVAIPGSASGSSRPAVTSRFRDVSTLDGNGLACNALPGGSLDGRIALILRGDCTFEVKLNNAERAGAMAAVVYTHGQEPDPITMAMAGATLPAVMIGNADGIALKATLQAEPDLFGTIDFSPSAMSVNPGRLSGSSSRGPSVDSGIKPELVGVGASVYTASPEDRGYQVMSGTSFSSPMVAGAAALLRAARPGLSADQYRSLLINSTASFPNAESMLGIQQAGTGLLNVAAALTSSVVLWPTVLNLGSGGGLVDRGGALLVTNLGSQPETFTIAATPRGKGPIPELSTNTLTLDPGASQVLNIRMLAFDLAPGEYSGNIVVRGGSSNAEARLPYWYGVESLAAQAIVVADAKSSASVSSTQRFLIRAQDNIGLAVPGQPVVTATEGGGAVVSVTQHPYYPGFYRAEVRLGPSAGRNVFSIQAAGATASVTIQGTGR